LPRGRVKSAKKLAVSNKPLNVPNPTHNADFVWKNPTPYSGLTHHLTAVAVMLGMTTPNAVDMEVICYIKTKTITDITSDNKTEMEETNPPHQSTKYPSSHSPHSLTWCTLDSRVSS